MHFFTNVPYQNHILNGVLVEIMMVIDKADQTKEVDFSIGVTHGRAESK